MELNANIPSKILRLNLLYLRKYALNANCRRLANKRMQNDTNRKSRNIQTGNLNNY
jgi:hypothetical protein